MLPDLRHRQLSGWRWVAWLAALVVAPLPLCLVAPTSNPLIAVTVWAALTLRSRWALLAFTLAAMAGYVGSYLALRAELPSPFPNYFFGGLYVTLAGALSAGLSILMTRLILRRLPHDERCRSTGHRQYDGLCAAVCCSGRL